MLYKDQKLHESCYSNDEEYQAFINYCNIIRGVPRKSVWYDMEEKICFGSDQNWMNSESPIESYFVSDEDNFLLGTRTVFNLRN